ncbi:methionyl-tRNA formyltransferase [Undibacterium baiyunense]|uniref:Methionyl-tRNA formyltransferase n=1 Tax=Undibacterium baiyunense TaxID=2828731 RepID=A0A941DGS6_9BURK|nr:methionyl-tRNA formyltransferase [Undibacterium baiyunense]MBR7748494.1 methionyl-tRNA formyltransferase [Undibacterium baiyunense]
MKVIFAGTPEFAAIALKAIIDAGYEVPLVLTQPDRPAGRGMQLQASAVKQLALTHQIPVAQPISLRLDGKYPEVAQEAHELLRNTPHDVMVVAAYGLILPQSCLSIPRLGCINIHGSLLPRWRGAAPIHRAIEAGDAETGITIMQMEEGLDTGPMLKRRAIPITATDTTASLHDQLATLGGEMIVEALRQLTVAPMQATTQPEDGVCYATKISKEEAAINFDASAAEIDRKIRAFNPFPAAHANIDGTIIKFWRAEVAKGDSQLPSGSIIDASGQQGILISCEGGKSVLRVLELQKPGGKRLAVQDFLQGFPLKAGQVFQS